MTVRAGSCRNAFAGGNAAGQGDAFDPRVVDDAIRLRVADQEVRVEPGRAAGIDPELLKDDRALRHDAGMLHHHDVAGHQMRAGHARELIVWEVPWLDAENHIPIGLLSMWAWPTFGCSFTGARKRSAFFA